LSIEAVPKLQFLEQQPIKTAVLQPIGRKTARACSKITDFGTGSIPIISAVFLHVKDAVLNQKSRRSLAKAAPFRVFSVKAADRPACHSPKNT
jgi:hypothetical protein